MSEKKPLAIQLMFDVETIRQCCAFVTGKVFTDEMIEERFFGKPVQIDLKDKDEAANIQLCASLVAIMLAEFMKPVTDKIQKPKSGWQKKLDELSKEK